MILVLHYAMIYLFIIIIFYYITHNNMIITEKMNIECQSIIADIHFKLDYEYRMIKIEQYEKIFSME